MTHTITVDARVMVDPENDVHSPFLNPVAIGAFHAVGDEWKGESHIETSVSNKGVFVHVKREGFDDPIATYAVEYGVYDWLLDCENDQPPEPAEFAMIRLA